MPDSDFYSIESSPEAFEWLDLAEEFFKHDGSFSFGEERNSYISRNGSRYSEIEREWEQLNQLYEACPEYFVEPLMALHVEEEGERRVVGFYMERFEGENLQDYLKNSMDIEDNREIADEIEELVRELGEKDVVHGDLANNGVYNGETFKFFDPVGRPYSKEDKRAMRKLDEGDAKRLRERAEIHSIELF